jgi:hypothetical protein
LKEEVSILNRKSRYLKLMSALVCTVLLSACGNNSATQSEESAQVEVSIIDNKSIKSVIREFVTYDKDDYYSDWKSENPNYVKLNGTTASLNGSGANVKDSKVTITSAGVYVISGKLDDGQIIVDVKDKGVVRLVLNGAEIKSSNNAPIYVKNAGKTIVSLKEGTENSIIDGEKYVFDDASTDEPNAALYSKDDLTINGTGKLIARGNYNNGITSKGDLKITSGDIQIYSSDDGLIGRDLVSVKNGTINIEAGGDGVKATNDNDDTKGILAIEDGTFDIKAKADGIQGETAVLIDKGSFNITSGGGSINGTRKAHDMKGPFGKKDNNATININTSEEDSQSAKAIKASKDIGVAGGTFNIDSADDSIHSNKSVTIVGGNINIASGDDGIHADSSIVVKGGKINITKSYEGIESALATVSGGEIHVTAIDDGINIAGGADESFTNNKLNINGGYITVNSNGDGLDSNGSIHMTKGIVVVSGPTSNGNGALDYNGTFEMTGALLVSAGSSGMVQGPSDTSTQYSIVMNYPQTQSAGTLANLQDSKGNTIATFAPVKDYQTLVISSPELKKGETYKLYSGGKSTGDKSDGLYTNGKYKDGTKILDFTISNSVTWLNESGVTTDQSSNFGRGPKGHPEGLKKPGDQEKLEPEKMQNNQ